MGDMPYMVKAMALLAGCSLLQLFCLFVVASAASIAPAVATTPSADDDRVTVAWFGATGDQSARRSATMLRR